MPIRAVWDWSKPTAARRMAGALGAAALTGLVGFLWAPQLQELTGRRPSPDRTSTLLQQTRSATAKLQTLRADLEGALGPDHFSGTVLLKRPNLAHIKIKGEGHLDFVVVSDGRKLVVYFPGDNRYTQSAPGPEGRNIQAFVVEQIRHFFRPDTIGQSPAGGRSSYVGRKTVVAERTEYEVVEVVAPTPQNQTTRYFVSPQDHLVHRVVTTIKVRSGETATTSANLKNIRTNIPIDESAFRWTLPPTAGPLQLPSGITLPLGNGGSR